MPPVSKLRSHRANASHPVIDLTCVDEPPGRPSRGRSNSLSRHHRRSHYIGGHVSRNRAKKASREEPIVVVEDEGQYRSEQQRLTKHERIVLRKSKELRRASNPTGNGRKPSQKQRSNHGSSSEESTHSGGRPWKRLFIDTSAMDRVLEDEVDDNKVEELAPAPDFMSAFSYQFKRKADPDEKSDVILLDDILPGRREDSEQSGRTKQATRAILKNGSPVWDLNKANAADSAWTSPTPTTLNEDRSSHETLMESHSARIESIRKAARFLQQQRKIQMEILQSRQTPSPTPIEPAPKTRNNMSAHWSPSCRKAMTFRKQSRSKSQEVVIDLVHTDSAPKTDDEMRQEEAESRQEQVGVLEISDSGLESSSTQETSAQSNVTKKTRSELHGESPAGRRENVADASSSISPREAEMNARAIESLYISPDSSTANESKSASAFDSPIGYVSPASSVSIASSSKTGRSQSVEFIVSGSPRSTRKDPTSVLAAGCSPVSIDSESKEHASPLAHSPSSESRLRSAKFNKGSPSSTLSRRHRAKSTGDLTSGYATKPTEIPPPFPEMKDPTIPAHVGDLVGVQSPASTQASFRSASSLSGTRASTLDPISMSNSGPQSHTEIPFAPDLQCSSGSSLERNEPSDVVDTVVTSEPQSSSSPKLEFTATTRSFEAAPSSSHPLSPTYSEREMMIAALSLDSSHRTSSVAASFSPRDSPYSPRSSSRTPALPQDASLHLETPVLSPENTESDYLISPISVDSGKNHLGVDRPSSPKIVLHSSMKSSVSSGLSAAPANVATGIDTTRNSPKPKQELPSQRSTSPLLDQSGGSPLSVAQRNDRIAGQDLAMASPNATSRSPASEQGSTHTSSHASPRSPHSSFAIDGAIGTSPLSAGSAVARSPTSCGSLASVKSKKQVSFCDSPVSRTSTHVSPTDHEPLSVDVNLVSEEYETQELGASSAAPGDIGMTEAHPIIQLENLEDYQTTRSVVDGPGMYLPASPPSQESGTTAASYWAVQSLPAYLDEPENLGASIIKPIMSCPSNTSLWSVDDQDLSPSPSLQRAGQDLMEDTSGGLQSEKPTSHDQADVMAILGSVQKSFGTNGYLFTWAMKPMVSFPHTNDSAVLKIEEGSSPERPIQATEQENAPPETTEPKSILKDGTTEGVENGAPERGDSPLAARAVTIMEPETEMANSNLSSNHEQTQDKNSWTEDLSTSEDGASIISEDRGSESFDSLESSEMYDPCGAKWADQLFDQTCTWLESKNLIFSLPPSIQKNLQKNAEQAPVETAVGDSAEKIPTRRRGVSRRNTRSTPLTKCFGCTAKKRRPHRKDKTHTRNDIAHAASNGGGETRQDSAILLSRDSAPSSDQRMQMDESTKIIQSGNMGYATTEGLRDKRSLVVDSASYAAVQSQQSLQANSVPPVTKSPSSLHPFRLSTTRMQEIRDEIGKITSLLVDTGITPDNIDRLAEKAAAPTRG